MKRFFKTMLSMLIVVVMLAQMFPVQLLVTSASAATTPSRGYYYKRVLYNQITPGKEYLILSSRGDGTSYALAPASGAASGNVQSTSSVAVTVSGDKVLTTDSNVDYKALEWEFIRSAPSANGMPDLYMLHNNSTGSWLWNPVYEKDSHWNMGTCITPEQDEYNGATMALFNFKAGTTAIGTANYVNAVNGTAAYQGQWLRVQSPSGGDGNITFNFTRTTLSADTWKYMAYTFHPGLTSDGTPLTVGQKIGIFTDTSTKPGPTGGANGYYYGGQTIGANWNSPTFDLYTSISNNGFKSGNIEQIRIDPQDGGDGGRHVYMDSVILGKTVRGIQTISAYRKEVADKRGGGLMPSVEYPFCQFSITQNGNGDGARLRFFAHNTAGGSNNQNDYGNAYYYLTAGSDGYTYNNEVTSVFFFEKVYETSPEYVYVQRGSNFEPGAEYILANVESGSGYAVNASNTNGGVTAITVTDGKITSGAIAANEVSAYKSSSLASGTHAGDFFWLVNITTRNFLMSYYNVGVIFSYPYASGHAGYHDESNGISNLAWKPYINSNKGALRAHMIEKDCGSNGRIVSITSSNMINGSSGAAYLYKKTYHEHTWTATGTSDATCTTGGGTNYRCSGCGQTQTVGQAALGHDYKAVVTNATCTTEGYTTYTCSRCQDSYTADHVNALGHAEQVIPGTPATCTSTGLTDGKKCSRCGITIEAQTTIPKLEHNWQVTSTEGTCGQVGVTNYTCSLCGATKREEGSVIEHLYDQVTVTAPTCTDGGYTTHKCSKCGDSYTDTPTEALGHDFGEWYTVTHATTTSEGLDRRDCSRCDDYETKITPMLESAKLKGSEVETTPGQTVTIDFELRGNPGIWGMNFVIYWPESLTFVKLESSDEAFELGNVEGNENAPVDPATNARMAEYFADANIPNPGNYMALAYYVDNGGFENNYNDGKIVSITFTLPAEGQCLKEYPVGVFGVFASSGNDIIDADGDSVADFTYIDGKITVPTGIDCDHSNYTTVTDSPATCTAPGAKHNVCNVCGHEFGHEVIPALGHSWTDFEIIREPSGLSAGISRRTCTVCGVYEDMTIEDKPATGTGISDSVNSELYRYYFTSRVYPGREYMILNASGAGSAYAMGATYDPLLDDNGNAYAGQFAVSSNQVNIEDGDYIINDNPALVWSTSTGFGFTNNATGTWLNGGLNHAEHVNQNVFTTATPYWNAETTQFTHHYKTIENIGSVSSESFSSLLSDDGLYIGFADVVAKAKEAKPANYFLKAGDNLFFKGSANGSRFFTDESWDFEFDISFREAEAYTTIYRDLDTETDMMQKSYDFALKITPENVTLMGVTDYNDNGNASKQYTIQTVDTTAHDHGEHSFNYTHWHHYRILCENKILRIYLDGHEIMVIRDYDIQPEFGFYFNVGTTKSGAAADGAVGLDNLFVRAQHGKSGDWTGSSWSDVHYEGGNPWGNTLYVSENFDSDADSEGNLHGEYHGEWDLYSSGMQRAEVEGDSGVIDEEFIVAEDVFIASRDYRNKVYFYEKRLVSEMSAIYQLAEGLEGGEAYVLVKANQAGASTMFNASTGKTEDVTVYEDGVSISPVMETYLPYIDLFEIGGTREFYDNSGESTSFKKEYGSACEFYATETEGGFLLNYVPVNIQENRAEEGTFLTPDGKFTSTATAANVIEVVDGKVTVNGEEYYVYKKVCVDQIDTAYESDMAVVDFGFGFSLNETFFRDNDPWADRVDVTLTGVAASLSAKENEWFYPLGTKLSGVGTTASFAEGTATMNGGISFANSGAYDNIVSVKYEGKVDHLSAYMYSTLYIIPATSVYYEDNIGFITYTDSNNIADGNGAWTTVAGDSHVVDVLDAQYGNSTTHSSYLQHSGNSVHYVKVGPANVPADYADGWMPTATFTFTGTGFDVISAVGRTTCVIFAEITDASGNYVDGLVVDNYLGYTYDSTEDKWTPSTGDNALQLYQVPVINWENTSAVPATYTVKISVAYDSYFDHAGVGYSEFYLDGLRIYNPLNLEAPENAVAVDKYKADKELIISDENLRRLLINSSTLESSSTAGVMFIDGNGLTNTTDALATYNEVGAANEITLPAGKGIAFTVNADRVPEKVALGVKVANGGAGSVTVASGSNSTSVNVSTATDMYYDVTSGIEWNGTTATVVITNTGSGAVSLTKIKLTTGSDEVATADFYVNARTENIAYRTLATTFGVNGEEFVVGDVKETQTVNSVDTLVLKKYLAGNTEFDNREFAAADIDGDGDVDGKDAMLLKKLLVK